LIKNINVFIGGDLLDRVLHVITDLNIGGAGMLLLNFLKKADRSAFGYTVALPDGSALAPLLEEIGIETILLRYIGERSLNFSAISKFTKLYKDIKPDIVHTHASLSARIAARSYGKCKIVHTRHCAFDVPRSRTVFPLRQLLGGVNNALSDHIIAISPAAAKNLTDMGTNPDKITVMFNGVEPVQKLTAAEKADIRRDYGIFDGEFVCAVIARMEEYKGIRTILEAAKLLREESIVFFFVGAGSGEGEFRKIAEDERLENVIFTGFVSDVYKIENITDLQLNASWGTETSSLSLLEGMSLGTPAVVSDYGGNPYIVRDGENGLVVPKRDARALAEAITSIMNDRNLRARLSLLAYDAYEDRFTADSMVKNVEDVYTAVLKAKK
jgi:glycosyltransferase involved in cell wall biosynthesis